MLHNILASASIAAFSAALSGAVSQSVAAREGGPDPERLLRHVVLFRFREGTPEAKVREIVEAFRALPGKIGAICGFEWGTDVSVENKSQGFTHCFLVSFRDTAGRDSYLPHPAHREFGELLHPHLEKVLVLDYWTGR
jgi:hypothetical protein